MTDYLRDRRLWIAVGAVAVLIIVLVLAWPRSPQSAYTPGTSQATSGAPVQAQMSDSLIPAGSEPTKASGSLVPAATDNDCKRQLKRLREFVRQYYNQHGRYPRELFDPVNSVGVPDAYKCPTSGRNYSYDPTRWPDRWVICTLPEHSDY